MNTLLFKLSGLFFKIHSFFFKWASQKQKHLLPPSELNKEKWYADRVEKILRYDYELNEKSTVLDVGGYEGDFAAEIFARYQSRIFVFEPVKKYISILQNRFKQNNNIHIVPEGLGNLNTELKITVMDEASSYARKASVHKSGKEELIKIYDVKEFMQREDIKQIDLIKINIEGAEYDLLDKIIELHYHTRFKNIQVQFHDFYPNYQVRYKKITDTLKNTHELTYCYPFVWENWKLKS
jgi:FkbM family methyltransferase